AGHIVDVEVDPETGKVQILRYTTCLDAGCAVHPSYVEGQMQGGTVQGVGWALNEEYFFTADGTLANSSFLDYRMPTTVDVPMIEPVILEVPNPRHPFGLRGVGEALSSVGFSLMPLWVAVDRHGAGREPSRGCSATVLGVCTPPAGADQDRERPG